MGELPGFSAAITLSNLFEMPGVDFLKLRGGYGVTGGQPAQSYLSLFTLAPGGNFFFNGAFTPAYGPDQNPNPDLAWEEKQDLSIGLDFQLIELPLEW